MQPSLKNKKTHTFRKCFRQDAKAMRHGGIFKVDLIGMEHPLRFKDVAVRHVLRQTTENNTPRFCTYTVGQISITKNASTHDGFSVLATGIHECKDT